MAYSNDWSDSVPIDHTKFKSAPGAIRQVRVDLEDRLKNIFYGFIAGEVQTDEGIKNLPFRYQAADPGLTANKIKVYSKQFDSGAGAKAELFMQDEIGTVMQLTAGGKWVGGGYKEIKMTCGTIAQLATKWPGWAICDGTNGTPDLRNRFIAVADADSGGVAKSTIEGTAKQSSSGVAVTGTVTGHALTKSEVPATTITIGAADANGSGEHQIQGTTNGASTNNYTFDTDGGGGAHTHGFTGSVAIPTWYALVFIMKL